MPEKDPMNYSLLTYMWVIGLSAWGGVVHYIKKIRDGETGVFSFTELLGEIVTSGFIGLLTFWLCEAAHFDQLVTAAMVGVSGHMGSKSIFLLESVLEKRYGSKLRGYFGKNK